MTHPVHHITHFAPSANPNATSDEHARQTTPTAVHELTLQQLAAACQSAARVGGKGSGGYITACAITGSRSAANAGPASLAILDWDDSPPDWEWLNQHEGFGWTTHSHDPVGDPTPLPSGAPTRAPRSCWRFVIPFVEPVSHGQLPEPRPGAHIRNRSQPAFLPTHPTDVAAIQFVWLGGTQRLTAAAAPEWAATSSDSLLAALFEAAGWALREQPNGLAVLCPWVHEHTPGPGREGGTVVLHDDADGRGMGKFHCSHGHCSGRGSRDALAVLRALPAVQAELRHWPEPTGLGAVWTRQDEPVDPTPPTHPFGGHGDGGALVPVHWSPHTQDLTGSPSRVQRALERWRRDQAGGGQVRPELQESSACLKWLAIDAQVPPTALEPWFGPQARRVAEHLVAAAATPQVEAIGRLTRITELLSSQADLRYNEMSLRIEVNGEPWTDAHTADARVACELAAISDPDKPVSNGDVEQCAKRLAVRQSYHPVREWLEALPEWDRVPRVGGLWVTHFGADNTPRNRALGSCFMLGAVKRILQPGCKVDMMPILYGPQGKLKSTAIEALACCPSFFSDAKLNFSHRSENAMTLAECWILEVAELEGFNRAEQNAVKAFTTIKVDRVLLPYARVKSERPRMSVMLGTTNEDQPLKDPTGNRRYPVIEIGRIDVPAIVRDREQLWAEALLRARLDEQHWLTPELELASAEVNEAHTQTDDAWLDRVQRWLAKPTRLGTWKPEPFEGDTFTVSDVLECALGLKAGQQDRAAQTRIGIALRRLGYYPVAAGDTPRRYPFPPRVDRG